MTRLSIEVRYVHDLFTTTTHKENSYPGESKFKRSNVTIIKLKHEDVAVTYDHTANEKIYGQRSRSKRKREREQERERERERGWLTGWGSIYILWPQVGGVQDRDWPWGVQCSASDHDQHGDWPWGGGVQCSADCTNCTWLVTLWYIAIQRN